MNSAARSCCFEMCKVRSTLVYFAALLCISCFTLRYILISKVIKLIKK